MRSRILRIACASFIALVLIAPLAAQQKRPMTFMDVMELRSVGNGSISPDGKWVLYTISIPQWKAGKNFTDVFISPTDNSSIRLRLSNP